MHYAGSAASMKLTVLDYLPDRLLERPASALYQDLDGPTLIHIPGHHPQPLFVSVLQHGNEVTGWDAVRRLLKSHYQFKKLPRSMLLYIGNVDAARRGVRHLDEQPDFNRCWPGSATGDSQYHRLFREVTDIARQSAPFASVDVHNTTGQNPHYGAVNRMDVRCFRLASMFSNTVIYFTVPKGVQSQAFSGFCPAVTLECGQTGNVHATDHTMAYLESCLNLEELKSEPLEAGSFDLYHTVATVRVDQQMSLGFGQPGADISLIRGLDQYNFRELPSNTVFGKLNGVRRPPLVTTDTEGNDTTSHYFSFDGGEIRTTRPLMPSMLTNDIRVIHQDCLCYLMERLDPGIHHRPEIEPLPEPSAFNV